MPLCFNIPQNLYINLKEAAEELSDEIIVSISYDSWTLCDSSDKVKGWLYFSEVGSFFDVEVSASLAEYETEINRFVNNLIELMQESVGSDACKTGRCAN